MQEITPGQLEWLFGLMVHDLRNPAATLAANLGFVKDGLGDPAVPAAELHDALQDSQQALGDLMRGLDQMAWMGRWFNRGQVLPVQVQDLRQAFEHVRARIRYGAVEFESPERDCAVVGGEALERLIELFINNGHQHAQGKLVRVGVVFEADQAVVEVTDEGKPLAPEFASTAFTFAGQLEIRGRADGRYGRVLGLFAAGILAEALGAKLSSLTRDGKNVFRIALQPG